MQFKELVVEEIKGEFNIELTSSSKITDVKIEDGNVKIKYIESGFMDDLDVYNFKVFVFGEKSPFNNLGSDTGLVEKYTFYGKKYYDDAYLYYFGKQIDRIKVSSK